MKSVVGDAEASGKKTKYLGLYPKKFDYTLGGYYHQERWARTRRYLVIKEATIHLSL
jgi:hypothetical protein